MNKKSDYRYAPDTNSTYEQQRALKKAQHSIKQHPDRVIYDTEFSFRDHPYRLLDHQKGTIGFITVRLLQGRGLKRSRDDWSLMALGPMKHLPLSHKHGEVRSSFCTFRLMRAEGDRKKNEELNENQTLSYDDICQGEELRSSTISNSNNPVWSDNRAGSHFVIPLKKGNLPDGASIRILARVFEPHTAVESMLPSQVKGGSQPLGQAVIDVTELCFGGETVKDLWVDLSPPNVVAELTHDKDKEKTECNGQLRVLVSYEPCGVEPKKGDTVCFEAFARSPKSLIVPPLSPMKVVNREGGYILANYRMLSGTLGTVRLHRNSVFVIERFSAIDGAIDFALTPTDLFFASDLGQQISHHTSPIVDSIGDFLKPVIMTGQLLTTVGISGVTTTAKLVLASMGQHTNNDSSSKISNTGSI